MLTESSASRASADEISAAAYAAKIWRSALPCLRRIAVILRDLTISSRLAGGMDLRKLGRMWFSIRCERRSPSVSNAGVVPFRPAKRRCAIRTSALMNSDSTMASTPARHG